MTAYLVPAILFLLLTVLYYRFSGLLLRIFEAILGGFIALPSNYKSYLVPAFLRTVRLNWYVFLMVIGLWFVLFKTAVGKDIVEMYMDNLQLLSTGLRLTSLFFLFITTFTMSVAIWVIPFFLYSEDRRTEIRNNMKRFYISTKLLAFFAMLPFINVTNAFFLYYWKDKDSAWPIIGINILLFFIFLLFIWIARRKIFNTLFDSVYRVLRLNLRNPYLTILVRILFWILLLIIPLSFYNFEAASSNYLVATYMFLSSIIVFRLLFYSNEEGKNVDEAVTKLVEQMISDKNRPHSKTLYIWIIALLACVIVYYYLLPSLEGTSTLYILLEVLSFFIIYLDLLRNVIRNSGKFWKALALFATILFLAMPFITDRNQFRIAFMELAPDISKKQKSFEEALQERLNVIRSKDTTANIYIICAMGGGSRAGYIAAGVLQQIDSFNNKLWDQTICYSTISGGSVGLYHYYKGKETQNLSPAYLSSLYVKNYNSSGVFGLLAGDAFESTFKFLITKPKSWILNDPGECGFHDRNHRIRREYDYALHKALLNPSDPDSYVQRSFYPFLHRDGYAIEDSFKTYFQRRGGQLPIHLVNTFEINSGQRSVLTPFAVRSKLLFPNALLPLEDTAFDDHVELKEIRYREAVNLSELFPLVSAASHIGSKSDAQFVDGGYFENYGLATGIDVYNYLVNTLGEDKNKVRILLIKNSEQEPGPAEQEVQLVAPLVGVMNSPFTGHANHFLEEAKRKYDSNFIVIRFDANRIKVPLTRALTRRHVDLMDQFLDSLVYNDSLIRFLPKMQMRR